jgi:hypothetical protein
MKRDYEFQQDRIDNVLLELANRGDAFFDEHLSLSNVRLSAHTIAANLSLIVFIVFSCGRLWQIFALARSEKLRGEFERTVVAETALQIER